MSEDKNPKKASDLLVEMDQKLDTILGIVKNQDNLIKILNNKISKISSPVAPSNQILVEQPDSSIRLKTEVQPTNSVTQLPGLKPGVTFPGIQQNNQSNLVESNNDSDDDFVNVEYESLVGRKVAVQQKITYADGKNICLASVEITGGNLSSPKKLKTNAMGKWMTVLEPGNYTVSVIKNGNKTKQNVSISSNFVVPESDKPVELPSISS